MLNEAVVVKAAESAYGRCSFLDLAASANWYLTPQQARLYEKAVSTGEYMRDVLNSVRSAEEEFLRLWRSLNSSSQSDLTIVDCGPGAHEQGVSHLLMWQESCSLCEYIVIDVNARLLRKAVEVARKHLACTAKGVRSDFWDLKRDDLRLRDRSDILFLFGTTGINIDIVEFSSILSNFCLRGDRIALLEIVRKDDDGQQPSLQGYCSSAVDRFVFEPVRLLGGRRRDFVRAFRYQNGRIEFLFKSRREVELDGKVRFRLARGCSVLTGFSRRPTERELEMTYGEVFENFKSSAVRGGCVATIGFWKGKS